MEGNIVVVILGVISIFWIFFLDHFGKGSLGLLELLLINLISIFIFYFSSKTKPYFCKFHFLLILIINFLLLLNTSNWNEGSMSGSNFIIPLLQPATDLLYGLLLFFIPLLVYLLFLYSVSKLFCRSLEKDNETK
jgi:hypothetical protein